MRLDIQKWNAERIELEKQIKESKERQRESFRPRWRCGQDDWSLISAKKVATELYTIRAALRNKNHMLEQTAEQTKTALEAFEKRFAIPAEEEKVVEQAA